MITVLQSPIDFAPAYAPVSFLVSSDNVAEPGFQYIAEVEINGSVITTLEFAPRPEDGLGVIRVDGVLRAFTTLNEVDEDTPIVADLCRQDYRILFGERYLVGGVTTDFPNLAQSSSLSVINVALPYRQGVTFDPSDYIATGESSRFLTNAPDGNKLERQHPAFLQALVASGQDETSLELRVEQYDENEILLDTTDSLPFVEFDAPEILRFPCGLDDLVSQGFASSQPLCKTYRVRLQVESTDIVLTEWRTFEIIEPCPLPASRILWLNRLGGIDGFTFETRNTSRIDAERIERTSAIGEVDSGVLSYPATESMEAGAIVTYQEGGRVTSKYLKDSDLQWLSELHTSPAVWRYLPGVGLLRVTLSQPRYSQQTTDEGYDLVEQSFEFKYTHLETSQRL